MLCMLWLPVSPENAEGAASAMLCVVLCTRVRLFFARRCADDVRSQSTQKFIERTGICINIFIYVCVCVWKPKGDRNLYATHHIGARMTASASVQSITIF